jgi:hypothetical protein
MSTDDDRHRKQEEDETQDPHAANERVSGFSDHSSQ